MANFKRNYLPSQSRPWAKQVEDAVDASERNLKSLDVNNRSKDEQFAASLSRLDSATTDAAVAAEAAAIAATQAGIAASDAQDAADLANGIINNIYTPGTSEINGARVRNGTITVNEIDTNYIYSGNISAGQISAGAVYGLSISGGTLSTSGSRHVEISGSQATFYDQWGSYSGRITAGESNRASTLYAGTGSSGVFMYNGGLDLEANGQVRVTGGNGFYSAGNITADNGLSVYGGANISGGLQVGQINSTGSSNFTHITASGDYNGNGFPTVASNTVSGTTTFAPNVFISSSSGNMARNTSSSERRAKENITNLEFDLDAFIAVNPVSFNYKREAVSDDEQAAAPNLGFILDDFADIGLSEFLIAEPSEGDEYKQLRYQLLYMYLHKVVQSQDATIKNLTARIEALEAK
jgi:hypothetical protein